MPTPNRSKDRRDAAVAAPWRVRPAVRGPADSVPGVSRELDRFESRTRNRNRRAIDSHGHTEHPRNDRCDAREALRQNARRACACATRTRELHPCSTLIVLVRAWRGERPRCFRTIRCRDRRTYCAVGLTLAGDWRLAPPQAHGQRQPDAIAYMGFPRSRLASTRAAASRQQDHLRESGTKTGRNGRPGRARANA